MSRIEILRQIDFERDYQVARWGDKFDDTHTPADWWTIVSMYLTRGLMAWKIDPEHPFYFDKKELRKNLVKMAAIIVAWIEAIDRSENGTA